MTRAVESITHVLEAAASGQPGAEKVLFELTYEKLRSLANYMMSRQASGHTLQATALVNEATLRLLGGQSLEKMTGSKHFYAAMAQAMRCVLVDHARKRKSQRSGGGYERVELDLVVQELESHNRIDLLELDEALGALELTNARYADLVRLRFFLGMTMDEIAKHRNVSKTSLEKDWRFVRALLAKKLRQS